jgi:tRNA uridine 5-carboxymethylaminomethyl modification enzyme
MKWTCERQEHLDLQQGSIAQILVEGDHVTGVTTVLGVTYRSKTVVITTGTFLQALMHVGLQQQAGGRMGDAASGMSLSLKSLGFELLRLKTGTPARISRRSINFEPCVLQPGDEPAPAFSYLVDTLHKGPDDIFTLNEWRDGKFHVEQIPCWMTYTTEETHRIIRANLDKSPMYCGIIEGVGPRYCPSIEDKVVRFADKDRHQIFLEPEGRQSDEFYIQGCSTSLPYEVQIQFVRSIPGLEDAVLIRPGYAVEYDFAPPTQLHPSLETKRVQGLFFAGQINGTSGYEEAGAQGLMAGINAALQVQGKAPVVLRRDQAYIGVLIDDLVTKGTQEPYRMFTSRAEHRLILRQDNADLRLTELGRSIGLASPLRHERVQTKQADITHYRHLLELTRQDQQTLAHRLKRPDTTWAELPVEFQSAHPEVATQIETDIKYAGYLAREQIQIDRTKAVEAHEIPTWLNYDSIPGLKTEARNKLKSIQPRTFGQASRISGINPTDLTLVQIWATKGRGKDNAQIPAS